MFFTWFFDQYLDLSQREVTNQRRAQTTVYNVDVEAMHYELMVFFRNSDLFLFS